MNENMRKRNEQLAKMVIRGLNSRNMSGCYAADKEEAVKLALELIPEGSTVAMGGCMTAHEIGLIHALENEKYHYIDRDQDDTERQSDGSLRCRCISLQRQCNYQ